MRTAIVIGAGLAGLSAARTLTGRGWSVTVLEQAQTLGGRATTIGPAGERLDLGAQFFSISQPRLTHLLEAWLEHGVAVPWCPGVPLLGQSGGEDGRQRYRCPGGISALAVALAGDQSVFTSVSVTRCDAAAQRWTVHGVVHGAVQQWQADALVLTPPVPLALALLKAGTQERPMTPALAERLGAVRYASCVTLLLEYPPAAACAVPGPGILRVQNDGPFYLLASQRAKGLRVTGESVVLHTRGPWADAHRQRTDAELLAELVPEAIALLGQLGTGSWTAPASTRLVHWPYNVPVETIGNPTVVTDLGAPVAFAGDAFGDRPRIEGSLLSGLAAAEALDRS